MFSALYIFFFCSVRFTCLGLFYLQIFFFIKTILHSHIHLNLNMIQNGNKTLIPSSISLITDCQNH